MDSVKDLLLRAGELTIQAILAGCAVTVLVKLAMSLLTTRLTAATRYVIWFATLVVIAALPVLLTLPGAGQEHALDAHTAVPQALRAVGPVETARSVRDVPTVAPLEVPVEPDAAGVAILLWIAGSALCAVRLLWSYRSIRKLKSSAEPPAPEAAIRFRALLDRWPAERRPALLAASAVQSPMAVGYSRPAVIVPNSLLLEINADQFDAVILHELAHVRHYDDWTRLAQCILRAVWFFHPAVHYICRQLDFERELACDDAVLSVNGAPRDYARSLTSMLEQRQRYGCHPMLASGAAFHRRQIVRRVSAILDKTRNAAPTVSPLGLVVLLMCLAGFSAAFIDLPALISFVEDAGGPVHRHEWANGSTRVWFEVRGNVELGDDEHLLDGLAPGASIKFGEGTWFRKAFEYRRDSRGELLSRYTVNGQERPIDPAVRRWADDLLWKAIRDTGFDAEGRTARLLEVGGPTSVFRELDRMSSDGSRARYLKALIHSASLGQEDMRRALSRVARMSDDSSKADALIEATSVIRAPEMRLALVDAARSIRESHQRRRVLDKLVEQPELASEPALRLSIVRAIATMESDSQAQADLLNAMLRSGNLPAADIAEIAGTAAKIRDPHHRARVLTELTSTDVSSATAGQVARSAVAIDSDSEKANILVRLAALPPSPDFLSAVRSIDSDGERRRVIDAMIERTDSTSAARSAAELAATLHSDGDKSQVLLAIATRRRSDPEVADAIRRAASRITSADEYRAVMRALEQP
ncbi:MAG TPA: M56 family metallopeptidase [Bryobacteraceae bacterium]|nr:M56 family metallopeptidase [Bryobacteraceae bacterium]